MIADDIVIETFDPVRDAGPLDELSRARLPHESVVARDDSGRYPRHQLVARAGGRLVGYAEVGYSDADSADADSTEARSADARSTNADSAHAGYTSAVDDLATTHLWIVVHPDWDRRGLATQLLGEAREFATADQRSSLVTAVDRYDQGARAWLTGCGFHEVGDLDIRRRRPRMGGEVTGADAAPSVPTLPDVQVLPTHVAGADADFVAAAATAMSSRPLPDGTRLVVSGQEIRDRYLGPTSDGQVYRSGAPGRWSALASVQQARSSGYSVEPVWADPHGAQALLTTVLTRVVADADEAGRELVLALSPLAEGALDQVTDTLGFESTGGRTTWRLSW